MRRGDVVIVQLDPARGSESNKTRMCVVVSNNGSNTAVERLGGGVITVVPLTSQVTRVHKNFQVLIEDSEDCRFMGLEKPSKAQGEQVRSVAAERVVERLGWVPVRIMQRIDDALRFHLSL